ncbi:hypothetical protein RFI_17696 [Reticulomyxa filosa]|uniref:NADP-dependent oxidoreductase domain-containing protein n=1 Tax=Reticulomyxa filosa TaxID=46433 RepID=X6MZS6_RETFI|nr:hypothetical protein RFI_17696 [Reticulomyxa filosa]|eukprot:ETO19530.1 hypothetical protein RFI_17696 [Reticulomyxa filosa]
MTKIASETRLSKYDPSKHIVKITSDGKNFSSLPLIGFGTFQLKGEQCEGPVRYALDCGYQHIDTAQVYYNEANIGKVVSSYYQKSGNKPFLTSKLAPKIMRQSDTMIKESIRNTLKYLETESLDLFLIHWPAISGKKLTDPIHAKYRLQTWQILEEFKDKGYFKNIGVSNYEVRHVQEIVSMFEANKCKYRPSVNQIEFHPLYTRWDIIEYCRKVGIQIISYASLGGYESTLSYSEKKKQNKDTTSIEAHPLLDHKAIQSIAQHYHKSAAQILLRWCIQHGAAIIPKSSHSKRIQENFDIFDFELSQAHIAEIDKIGADNKQRKFAWNPSEIV